MNTITVKSRIPFKAYFNYIFRENFFKPLIFIILFFTLVNLFLVINHYAHFLFIKLSYPWFHMLLVLVVLVVIPIGFYVINKKEYYANAHLQEYKVFEFSSDYVLISNHDSSLKIEWNNLYKVEESRDFLILFYDYATAYFILKTDFENPAQLKMVMDIIKTKPGLVQAFLK